VTEIFALVFFGGIGAVVAWFAWITRDQKNRRGNSAMRKEYRALTHLPQGTSAAAMDTAMKEVRKRFPGRSEKWHLKRIISELRKG
jgi:hypothetical protein